MDSTVLDAGIAAQQLQLVNAIVDEDRQYATRLTITRTDNENASESVISTVISWLMKKKVLSKEHCDSFREGTYSTPDSWNGTTELEQGKTALASKRNSGVPGCVVWAMELDEQDHRLIYGRWHPFGIDLYLPAISYLHISCSSLRHFWRDVGSAVFCAVGHGGGSLHLVPNFSKSWKPHSSLCCFMRIRSSNRL